MSIVNTMRVFVSTIGYLGLFLVCVNAQGFDTKEAGERKSNLETSANLQQKVAKLEETIDELEERADDNELQAALSKIKFGLDFNTTLSNFFINDDGTKLTQPNRWAMGLYLNMNANINEYTKFTGRLSMTKAFGDISWGMPQLINALDAGRAVGGGPSVFVDRAYIDIYGGDIFAFTIGRLPSTDGPGANLRNGSARMATYPALIVNALGDGVVFTFKPYADSAIRTGYSKIYQPLSKDSGGVDNIFGTRDAIDANLFFATFETPFLPRSVGQSLFMLSYAAILKYAIPAGAITIPSGMKNKNSNIGDIHYINVHFENNNLLDSGFNWFVSGTYYMGHNPKNAIFTNGTTTQSMPIFNDHNGFAVHIGARYDIESFKIGYEYFYGSKYWYAMSRVSINDLLNFRNTRGDVHDIYAIYQIDLNQLFRLSYTRLHSKYKNPGVAITLGSGPTNSTIDNIALSYILRF